MNKKLQIEEKNNTFYMLLKIKSLFSGYCPRYKINQNVFKESHKKNV